MQKSGKAELVEVLLDLAKQHAEETDTKPVIKSKKDSSTIIDLFAEAVKSLVQEEGDVLVIQNFIRLEKYLTKETRKHNPQTGEMFTVGPKLRVKAKANFE